jgi:heme-degrading monooxygenase HmoA
MILEVAILNVVSGREREFETAFGQAQDILASMAGYLGHELRCCVEARSRYILLVRWETLEDHTVGFRGSAGYQQWKRMLHLFYDPFPVVEHYAEVSGRAN